MTENSQAKILGRYIVADPRICHGKPTFRGTRVMVWQILELLEDGMSWERITENFNNSFPREAIAEAIQLSRTAFVKHWDEFEYEPARQSHSDPICQSQLNAS